MLDLGCRYFGLKPSSRLNLVVKDGLEFLMTSPMGAFDIVILDAAQILPAVCCYPRTDFSLRASTANLSCVVVLLCSQHKLSSTFVWESKGCLFPEITEFMCCNTQPVLSADHVLLTSTTGPFSLYQTTVSACLLYAHPKRYGHIAAVIPILFRTLSNSVDKC
jgi:hypothetical protein